MSIFNLPPLYMLFMKHWKRGGRAERWLKLNPRCWPPIKSQLNPPVVVACLTSSSLLCVASLRVQLPFAKVGCEWTGNSDVHWENAIRSSFVVDAVVLLMWKYSLGSDTVPLLLTSLAATLAVAAAASISNSQQLPDLVLWIFRAASDSAWGKRQLPA